MENETTEVLRQLTDLGSEGVQRAVTEYARWYLVSAIGWLFAGLAGLFMSYKIMRLKVNDYDAWNDFGRYMVAGLIAFIMTWIVIYNASTIVAPTAYAINHLINQITP